VAWWLVAGGLVAGGGGLVAGGGGLVAWWLVAWWPGGWWPVAWWLVAWWALNSLYISHLKNQKTVSYIYQLLTKT
jgi:hypothetical protein